MSSLPTGTVTFLFTDIEGSTKLARAYPDLWEPARARHHEIVRAAIESHHGFVFQNVGDALCAAFHKPGDAVRAAVQAQRGLKDEVCGAAAVRSRMGIHTGEAESDGRDYQGYITLSLVQRIMSAAHGGQILLSDSTQCLLRDQIPTDVSLDDLGEHRFKDVPNPVRVYQVGSPDLQREFPALGASTRTPNNLPVQITSFVGREKEIEQGARLLREARLITLTGAGGSGKTRLSLQVALTVLDIFRDGVWLVELAPISDPALVPGTVAGVLHISEQPGRPLLTTLIDWLADQQLLLVLDNCEHLIEACARFADDVLHACPGVRILTTSREALGIAGEEACYVPSLRTPDRVDALTAAQAMQYESVRLFVQRASSTASDFALTESRVAAVVQICRRLDGIPLAIELAAARVRSLSVEDIAGRLNDCFRLLTGGSRTALPRHQALRSLIDWSHSLLNEPEKTLLRRLSVFAGGWTLDAAESVCSGKGIERGDVLELLSHLVDKSLVLVGELGGRTRYRMLETIRQYAREKLFDSGEGEMLRRKHSTFFFALADEHAKGKNSAHLADLVETLHREMDNFRAALDWCLDAGDAGRALHAVVRIGWAWSWTYFLPLSEGRDRLEQLLRASPEPSLDHAYGLQYLGVIVREQGQYLEALDILEQARNMAQALGDRRVLAHATFLLSWPLLSLGRQQDAVQLMEESLRLFREEQCREEEAFVLVLLGEEARMRGDWPLARELNERAIGLLAPLNEKYHRHVALGNLGILLIHFNELERSRALLQESLHMSIEIGARNTGFILMGFSFLINAWGRPMDSARLLGASNAIEEREGQAVDPGDRPDYDANLASLHAQLDAAAFAKAWDEGRAMTPEQAISFALAALAEQPS